VIDFHCHIDLYQNPAQVLESTVLKRCYVLAVTTTPLAWDGTKKLIGDAPRIRMALGLHPELISTRHNEIAQFCGLLSETRFLGEIGIDGSKPHRSSIVLQREIFRTILQAAQKHGGRIMSIHSRGATSEVLDEIERCPESGTHVLHWFSGTMSQLKRAIELGCWFSVGPAMLKSAKGLKLAEKMPDDRIITETDGPFTSRNGVPLMPWDVSEAERVLGNLWNKKSHEINEIIESNFSQLARSL